MMVSEELEKTIRRALMVAYHLHHEFATLEHLLLVMMKDPYVLPILQEYAHDLDELEQDLQNFISSQLNNITVSNHKENEPQPSSGVKRVLQRSIVNAQRQRLGKVTGANMLISMFEEIDSYAVYYLHRQGVTLYDTINYIASQNYLRQTQTGPAGNKQKTTTAGSKSGKVHAAALQPSFGYETKEEPAATPKELENFCIDISLKAKQGEIDKLVGRVPELKRTIQILCRRNKNNPLLIGEPGVGKTAIAEGLAHKIIHNLVPEPLRTARIFCLDLGAMLAGTRYRGDFEERLKNGLKWLQSQPNTIVFIDEIHTVIGAGASSGSSMDASNLLKPVLAKGKLRCIGATTYKEYRQHFEKDRALLRRFQKVDITEPSISDSIEILNGIKGYYEQFHKVTYTPQAIQRAVELSERFIHERRLPDKAIDVIDEAGAALTIMRPHKNSKRINHTAIADVVAMIARIPKENMNRDSRRQLVKLAPKLKRVIVGQDSAVDSLVESIKLARAGLRNAEKPIGSYLFTGPTGVGKTEVCRQLAELLGMQLIRFDMSEYIERHTVSRLLGAPPGYIGHDQGGQLTDAIENNPYSVLLLDEIEKAHLEVYNILLQVMDYGRLTDANGKLINFRNVILIMTSNAGAREAEKSAIGFSRRADTPAHEYEGEKNLRNFFTPEFRNRLDAIIKFSHLRPVDIAHIVDKHCQDLHVQLAKQGTKLHVTPSARRLIAERGYSRAFGARELERIIERQIKLKLADEMLFGKLRKGGKVKITVNRASRNKEFVFIITPGKNDKPEVPAQLPPVVARNLLESDISPPQLPRPRTDRLKSYS